jgi:hypothetical protein
MDLDIGYLSAEFTCARPNADRIGPRSRGVASMYSCLDCCEKPCGEWAHRGGRVGYAGVVEVWVWCG